jgi:hypothetical protein
MVQAQDQLRSIKPKLAHCSITKKTVEKIMRVYNRWFIQGILAEGGRLVTFDLFIKVACLVKSE